MVAMQIETRFRRLFKPAAIGDRIDGWRVCWVGGWDKYRVLFVVMVERRTANSPGAIHQAKRHDIFRYRQLIRFPRAPRAPQPISNSQNFWSG